MIRNKTAHKHTILLGKKPGAIALHLIFFGPNSTAKLRVRWMTADFEALYDGVPCEPVVPIPTPATEAVVITREGSVGVARAVSRGRNLLSSVGRLVGGVL